MNLVSSSWFRFALLCVAIFIFGFSATSLVYNPRQLYYGQRVVPLLEVPNFGSARWDTWVIDPEVYEVSFSFLDIPFCIFPRRIPTTYVYPRGDEVIIFCMHRYQSVLEMKLGHLVDRTYREFGSSGGEDE